MFSYVCLAVSCELCVLVCCCVLKLIRICCVDYVCGRGYVHCIGRTFGEH